jgi:hypothetical protein
MQYIAVFEEKTPTPLYVEPKNGTRRHFSRWNTTLMPGWRPFFASHTPPFAYQYLNDLGLCLIHQNKSGKHSKRITATPVSHWERWVFLHCFIERWHGGKVRPHVLRAYHDDDDIVLPFGYQQWDNGHDLLIESYVSQKKDRVLVFHDPEKQEAMLCIDAERNAIPRQVRAVYQKKQPLYVFLKETDSVLRWYETTRGDAWSNLKRALRHLDQALFTVK